MINHEKESQNLIEKYLPGKKQLEYYEKARDLISDIAYLKEHHRRTRKSSYGVDITPTLSGLIVGHFLYQIFSSQLMKSYWDKEKYVILALQHFVVSQAIVDIIYDFAWHEKLKPNVVMDDYEKLREVLRWYYEIDIDNLLGCFIGCSAGYHATFKAIEKNRRGVETDD